ncbi:fibronectin type III domain-containing protein [Aetokthonos hydrillicola Thurmond2011]|uniref:Fibronectin type III domain-containing protein n=2 Tax=Aetokthonos TaxID=1550243 RepID=A0AAP5IFX5_9CYAN|nr:fibronectin type III domain-containing protein [Aetokthonos hydrillicola Thurmond2011]
MTELLADHPSITGGTPQNGVIDFVPPATGVYYIGFHVYSDADEFDLYLDDISVTLTPTCDVPGGLTISNITTTDVLADWTAPTTGGSPASYSVYYNTSGTAPALTAVPSVSGLTAISNTIGSLTPGTTYYLWVRSVCSASDSSAWAGPVTFTTQCVPVTTLPWTENFDALTTVGEDSYPACWLKENGDWETTNEPAVDNYAGPRSGSNYLINSWSATDEFIWSPGFQLTAGVSYDFSFYFAGDTFTGWTGDVFANSAQSGSGATQLGGSFVTTSTTTTKNYVLVKRSFIPSATGEYFFAIRINANGTPWYLAFDDFKLELTPDCTEPTDLQISNITTTVAQLDWTAPISSSPASYSIYLSTSSTTPALTAVPVVAGVTGASYTFSNLNPGTVYYVWVRSKCTATDSSEWAGPISFTTQCVAITTLPWTENFDGLTSVGDTKFPVCWFKENGDWATSNEPNGGNYPGPRSGANYLLNKWSATDEYMWTPAFQLTAGVSYDFSFYYAGDLNDGWTGDVFVGSSASGATATQVGTSFITASVTPGKSYTQVKRSFTPSATGEYYFAIRVNATSNPWYLSFDDFKLEPTPSCTEPTALMASAVTTSGAQIDWTAPDFFYI